MISVLLIASCTTPQPQKKIIINKCDLSELKSIEKKLLTLANMKAIDRYYEWMSFRHDLVSSLDGSDISYQIATSTDKKVVKKAIILRETINKLTLDIEKKDCTTYYGFKRKSAKKLESINNFLSSEERDKKLRKSIHKNKQYKLKLAQEKKQEAEKIKQAIKERKAFYSSITSAQYKDNNMSIQLVDFNRGTATLLLTNVSRTKIITPNYQHCELQKNELGGEECFWNTKTISSSDEYGNKHQIYWLRPSPIELLPNESAKLQIPLGKTIPKVTIKLKFLKQSVGNENPFILHFK